MDYYNTSKIYNINELNIPIYSFILIASSRRSGKTILMIDLLQHILKQYDIDFIILFSETCELDNEYNFLDKTQTRNTKNMDRDIEKII